MLVMDLINYLKIVPYTYYPNLFPPISADDCAIVRLTGGTAPQVVGRPSWQVIVRSANPANAESTAWEVYNLLNRKRNFSVGATHVVLCNVQQSTPVYIGTDENGRFLYSINFTAITE